MIAIAGAGKPGLYIWFWIPLILITAINIIIFFVYQQSHLSEPTYNQIWDYLQSQSFIAVTGSLLFPIALFLLESRFQILQKREDETRERKQKRDEEARQRGLKCRRDTANLWQQLQRLATEVATFRRGAGRKDEAVELARHVEAFKDDAEILAYEWMDRFPSLSSEDLSSLLAFFNLVYVASQTVAYRILDASEAEDLAELQLCLSTISSVSDNTAFYRILNVFDSLMELESSIGTESEGKTRSELRDGLDALQAWADEIDKRGVRTGDYLSFMTGESVENLRRTLSDIESEMRKLGKTEFSGEYEHRLHEAYSRIPKDQRIRLLRYGNSEAFIREMADWLTMESLRMDVQENSAITP